MKIIVGIGNPGNEYKNTRHNLGFMVLDRFADYIRENLDKTKFNSLFKKISFDMSNGKWEYILLVKPQTYVNLSGTAVKKFIDYFEVGLKDVLVVSDDFNLPLGKVRIRKNGSSGGHKGLKSIIEKLGSLEFPRLRIGTGEPSTDPSDFVLNRFKKAELKKIQVAIETSVHIIRDWIEKGTDYCSKT